jgi:hypothetical protein
VTSRARDGAIVDCTGFLDRPGAAAAVAQKSTLKLVDSANDSKPLKGIV